MFARPLYIAPGVGSHADDACVYVPVSAERRAHRQRSLEFVRFNRTVLHDCKVEDIPRYM